VIITWNSHLRYPVVAILAVGVCLAQPSPNAPHFIVASLKELPGPYRGGVGGPKRTPGRFVWYRVSLGNLILTAYEIPPERLSGPSWLNSVRLQLVATVPARATTEDVDSMIQTLLAERFGLRVHLAAREGPVYAVRISQEGLKIKEAPHSGSYRREFGPNGAVHFSGQLSMDMFLRVFSIQYDRPFLDMTGLKGAYTFDFDYSRRVPDTADGNTDYEAYAKALFKHFEEDLGLSVDRVKGPVPVVVIDHVEKSVTGN
jgi:uncharacterized protein (TIGR03435 family)